MRVAPRRPLILASLLPAAFAINGDTTIVNVVLPTLACELHATARQLQPIIGSCNLVFAALVPVTGSVSDRVNRKGMLLAGRARSAWQASPEVSAAARLR